VALNRSIILKNMNEIFMTATSNRTYYHKVQDHSLGYRTLSEIDEFRSFMELEFSKVILNPLR
jgi:hypothetical protein